jgi:hypothetical protein
VQPDEKSGICSFTLRIQPSNSPPHQLFIDAVASATIKFSQQLIQQGVTVFDVLANFLVQQVQQTPLSLSLNLFQKRATEAQTTCGSELRAGICAKIFEHLPAVSFLR